MIILVIWANSDCSASAGDVEIVCNRYVQTTVELQILNTQEVLHTNKNSVNQLNSIVYTVTIVET